MTLDEFVKAFAAEFDETPVEVFNVNTEYKKLEEWNSLTALSIIAMIDDACNITITGADLRAHVTIEELYNAVICK